MREAGRTPQCNEPALRLSITIADIVIVASIIFVAFLLPFDHNSKIVRFVIAVVSSRRNEVQLPSVFLVSMYLWPDSWLVGIRVISGCLQ